jgi:hypothetical protein
MNKNRLNTLYINTICLHHRSFIDFWQAAMLYKRKSKLIAMT